jgi:hypothetical protein
MGSVLAGIELYEMLGLDEFFAERLAPDARARAGIWCCKPCALIA